MRIAVIVSTFPPYRGGMGNVAAQQAALLAAQGHEVTVYTPVAGESRTERRDGYTVRFVTALFSVGNAAFVPQLFTAGNEADVVILHYPFQGGAESVAISRRIKKEGAKLVVYYHMDLLGQALRDQIFQLYSRLFLSPIIKSADALAVSSADYAMTGALAPLWATLPAKKLFELPPAVDTAHFRPMPARPEVRERFHLPPAVPLILFVGGLDTAHYFKGLEVLLRAVTHIVHNGQPCALLVVGDGDMRQRYEEMAHTLGMVEQVRFAGSVPRDQLVELYNNADVLALPSVNRAEAFGMVCLEAMACAKPVIASRLPGVRTVVRDGETGILVEPSHVQALSDALLRICADPEYARRLGEAGSRRVQEHYTMTHLSAGLTRLLSSLSS